MSFASYGRACDVPDHLVDEFVQICLKRFAEKKSPPAIFKGLRKVVRRLAIINTLAVITTNSSLNVNTFLIKRGLDGYVRAVYGVDSPGSKAQKISTAREQFSVENKRGSVFMVGDSLSDIRAAKEASVISIAVTWGHQSLSHLLAGSPDYIVHFPTDLLEVIEK